MKIFYATSATASGGRDGTSRLDDGSFKADLASPQTDMTALNPEKLFALGYAACFDSAMQLTAKQLGLSPEDPETTVKVGIGQNDSGGYSLEVDIVAHLQGMNEAEAHKLVMAAHEVCPYSNATRGNIDVRLYIDI